MSRSMSTPARLREYQPVGRQAEDAALGDVENGLAGPAGDLPGEGHVLDILDEFAVSPSRTIFSAPPSSMAMSSLPATKVPTNTTFLAFWLMLMKPPAPGEPWAEFRDVEVAGCGPPAPAPGRRRRAAAVVEIELVGAGR